MVAALLGIQAGSSDGLAQVPVALQALKDWSAWLVSIQTAVIGLAALVSGGTKIATASPTVAKVGLASFAASIVCATFALGAVPSILIRIEEDQTEYPSFYRMPISAAPWLQELGVDGLVPPLYVFTAGEHIFFLFGVAMFLIVAVRTARA